MKYVGYYRISTTKQGIDGLSIDAQKQCVNDYLSKVGGELIAEFKEQISGKVTSRKQLSEALRICKREGATIIIYRLDRLVRKLAHVILLRESGVKFLSLENPYMSEFEVNLRVCFAEEELRKIAERTKNALDEIKNKLKKQGYYISKAGNKITKLGNDGKGYNPDSLIKARKELAENAKANENNKRAKELIKALHKDFNYREIAEKLNKAGYKTSRGKQFTPMQVYRLAPKKNTPEEIKAYREYLQRYAN